MLTLWLPSDEPDVLPAIGNTSIGVGCLVFNSKRQVLAVQEKHFPFKLDRPFWKLCGGAVDEGEDLTEAAVRELKEETGIDGQFLSLVALRHYHQFRWSTSDLWAICLMRALDDEQPIQIQESEIKAAQWMNFDAFFELDSAQYIAPLRQPIGDEIDRVLSGSSSSVGLTPISVKHAFTNSSSLFYFPARQ